MCTSKGDFCFSETLVSEDNLFLFCIIDYFSIQYDVLLIRLSTLGSLSKNRDDRAPLKDDTFSKKLFGKLIGDR